MFYSYSILYIAEKQDDNFSMKNTIDDGHIKVAFTIFVPRYKQ